jgi:hypothetical protein
VLYPRLNLDLSSSSSGRGAVRVAKNYTKGYSDTQVKIRGATSNDPWGPSGAQMNEIAQMTYSQNEFVEVMEMLDKRLNDKGKNWRHVFKVSLREVVVFEMNVVQGIDIINLALVV